MFDSVVKEVAVYGNGGMIKRSGTVHLKEGRQTVQIGMLSRGTDENTIRLSVSKQVSASNIQPAYFTKEEQAEALEEINNRIQTLNNRIAVKQKQIELWQDNADFSQKESISIADMADYIDKLPQRLETLQKEINELEKETRKVNEELSKKKKEVARCYVNVDMEVAKEGDYPFELVYFAQNIGWAPFYELHTDTENNQVKMQLRAKMRNHTEEDLKKVTLALFTGNPSTNGTIPELYPQYLSIYVPRQYAARESKMMGNMAYMQAGMAMDTMAVAAEACEDTEELMEVPYAAAAVVKGDTMTEYDLPGSWDMEHGKEIIANISETTIGCQYHDVTVPKIDDGVYLAAEVKSADLEDFVGSEAAVYHNDTFMGNVYLQPNANEEKYDISLGRDETIKVSRKQLKRHSSNVLLKGQRKTEFEYEIKATSRKPTACRLTVIDQIPVSQDKSIEVRHNELSGGQLKEDSGEIRWEFDLENGQTKTLLLSYDVAWPKDKQINL